MIPKTEKGQQMVRIDLELRDWIRLERGRRIVAGDHHATVGDVVGDAIRFYRQHSPFDHAGELDGAEEAKEV